MPLNFMPMNSFQVFFFFFKLQSPRLLWVFDITSLWLPVQQELRFEPQRDQMCLPQVSVALWKTDWSSTCSIVTLFAKEINEKNYKNHARCGHQMQPCLFFLFFFQHWSSGLTWKLVYCVVHNGIWRYVWQGWQKSHLIVFHKCQEKFARRCICDRATAERRRSRGLWENTEHARRKKKGYTLKTRDCCFSQFDISFSWWWLKCEWRDNVKDLLLCRRPRSGIQGSRSQIH